MTKQLHKSVATEPSTLMVACLFSACAVLTAACEPAAPTGLYQEGDAGTVERDENEEELDAELDESLAELDESQAELDESLAELDESQAELASTQRSLQLPIAQPVHYSVRLRAGTGTHDGTVGKVWFRLYSEKAGAWTSWRSIDGIARGASVTTVVSAGPNFLAISKIQVLVGSADGARISAAVVGGAHGNLSFTPDSRWIAGSSVTFSVVVADGGFCWPDSPAGCVIELTAGCLPMGICCHKGFCGCLNDVLCTG